MASARLGKLRHSKQMTARIDRMKSGTLSHTKARQEQKALDLPQPASPPTLVRDFQSIIGEEVRWQMAEAEGRLPDSLVACIGGGSNAMGLFHPFLDDASVQIYGVEAGGDGVETGRHAASLTGGRPGVLHGNRTYLLQNEEGQPIDLLINNAGLGYLGPVAENPPERESEMAQINVAAPVELTRALLPGMLKRAEGGQRGGIIFVASAAAFMPIPLFATYAASKAFLLHYAEALAEELSDTPVDVLALCPGATRSRFFERARIARSDNLLPMHEPDRVVREGLRALGNRVVHVVGSGNYLATAAARFLPRRLVAAAAERAMRRWQ
jgi:short-subunit dehydrogenase